MVSWLRGEMMGCHGMGWDVMCFDLARARSPLSKIDTDVHVFFAFVCYSWE